MKQLGHFLEHKLVGYERDRNDPNNDGQSGLSPYLHFGQISAQRIALEVLKSMKEAGCIFGGADSAKGIVGQLLLLQPALR